MHLDPHISETPGRPSAEARSPGFFDHAFEEHAAAVAAARAELEQPFEAMVELCGDALRNGGKLLLFGNGGSAADAQHIATELTVRFISDRKPLAAIALTTDTSALTAIGNDLGFDQLFARQIEALGKSGDVAIAFSTSGNSANITRALKAASAAGIGTALLSGRNGGEAAKLADLSLIVPAEATARIQEIHILLGHMLCGALERRLGLV